MVDFSEQCEYGLDEYPQFISLKVWLTQDKVTIWYIKHLVLFDINYDFHSM